jgi:ABC-type amino acid transport substrate-binding protein
MKEQKYFTTTLIIVILSVAISLVALIRTNKRSVSVDFDDTLTKIRQTNVIQACTVVSPPFSIKDAETGERSGYMIDLLKLVAQKMEVQVIWNESTWGNAVADLQSHRCDVVAAELFANIPRAKAVAFTKPSLFYMGNGAIVRKDDKRFDDIQTIYDLDKPDITVVVATGEAGDIFVRENFKQAQVRKIDVESSDLTRFALDVSSGRADVAIAGGDVVDLYIKSHPEVKNIFAENPFGLNPIGWAVRQDDYRWKDFLETAIQFLDTQGDMLRLKNNYNLQLLEQVKEYQI